MSLLRYVTKELKPKIAEVNHSSIVLLSLVTSELVLLIGGSRFYLQYRVAHLVGDLGLVDFDFSVPPFCPLLQHLFPNSHQAKGKRADSGTLIMGHPVLTFPLVYPMSCQLDDIGCTEGKAAFEGYILNPQL